MFRHEEGINSMLNVFQRTQKKYGNYEFLGARDETQEGRPYVYKTYNEVATLAENFAKGINHLGLCPE